MNASVSEEELERMEAENRAASSWGASLATPVPGAVSNAMVLVPREPTEAMIEAHFAAHAQASTVFAEVRDIWRAMIDAAQTGQKPGERAAQGTPAEAQAGETSPVPLEAAVQSPPIVGVRATGYVRQSGLNSLQDGNHTSIYPTPRDDYQIPVYLAAPVEAVATEPVAWLAEGDGFKSFTRQKSVADRWLKGSLLVTPVFGPTGDSGALREAPTVEQLRQAAIDKGWLSTLDGIDRIVADLRLAIPSKGDLGK
jgi:hypothetical protein